MNWFQRLVRHRTSEELKSIAFMCGGASLLVGVGMIFSGATFNFRDIQLAFEKVAGETQTALVSAVPTVGNYLYYTVGAACVSAYGYAPYLGSIVVGGADILSSNGSNSSPNYAYQQYSTVSSGGSTWMYEGGTTTIEWSCVPYTYYASNYVQSFWYRSDTCNGYGYYYDYTTGVSISGPGVSISTTTLTGSYTFKPTGGAGTKNYAVTCQHPATGYVPQMPMNLTLGVLDGITLSAPSYVTLGSTGPISWSASQAYATSSCSLIGPTSAATSSPVYVAPKFVSTGTTLPVGTSRASQITIGNTTYLFGGIVVTGNPGADTLSSTIYSAPSSNLSAWAAVGNLPVALANSSIVRIGNTLYLLGGQVAAGATKNIYTASVSSPTSWSLFGQTLVDPIHSSSLIETGNTLYLYGGIGAAGTSVNSIYSAPTATLVWTKSASTLPAALSRAQAAIINGVIYLFGGNP